MDEVIEKITLLSGVKKLKRPYKVNDKIKNKMRTLEKELRKAKTLKNNINIAKCLYWMGEEQLNEKFYRMQKQNNRKLARNVYTLVQEDIHWLDYFGEITLKTWRKLNVKKILEGRKRLEEVLDGARINVGEDVNPRLRPDDPQQETAVVEDGTHNFGWTGGEDQFLNPSSRMESYDLEEALRLVSRPNENEGLGQSWEDLLGISEDILEVRPTME
jgi:hypothetical protein